MGRKIVLEPEQSIHAALYRTPSLKANASLALCTAAIACLLTLMMGSAPVVGQINIPDTPAGHIFEAWLDAFNSGDRSKIEAYIQAFAPKLDVDGFMAFRGQTGGFDLLSIDASEALAIKFRVKEKASPTVAIGAIRLEEGQPAAVKTLMLLAVPPGAVIEDVCVDAQSRQRNDAVLAGATVHQGDVARAS
jgi:hypothetical protein